MLKSAVYAVPAQGVGLPGTVLEFITVCYSPLELRKASPLGHQGQANKGHPLCGLCALTLAGQLVNAGGGARSLASEMQEDNAATVYT